MVSIERHGDMFAQAYKYVEGYFGEDYAIRTAPARRAGRIYILT